MSHVAQQPDDWGSLVEPATLQIQRLLPGPVERVWAWLTEEELRRQWLAAGQMELEQGAEFELVWRNDELSSRPTERPAGFPAEDRMRSRITELDAPRRLGFEWAGGGEVTFDLEGQGEEVLLTVTHRRLGDRRTMLQVAAGWHMHLDLMVAHFAGRERPPFWEGWSQLRNEYERRLGGGLATSAPAAAAAPVPGTRFPERPPEA